MFVFKAESFGHLRTMAVCRDFRSRSERPLSFDSLCRVVFFRRFQFKTFDVSLIFWLDRNTGDMALLWELQNHASKKHDVRNLEKIVDFPWFF